MSGKLTDVFRQQKPGSHGRSRKKEQLPELLGAHGEAAVTDQDASPEERLLRAFDLDTRFGPCTGLTRLERWERAAKFGLDPPLAVRQMLTAPQGEGMNACLWEGRL